MNPRLCTFALLAAAAAPLDIDAIQNPDNFYSFDRERTRAAYRKAIQKELDDINSNVSRLGLLPRSNSSQ